MTYGLVNLALLGVLAVAFFAISYWVIKQAVKQAIIETRKIEK